jgi:hypothetical protein
VIDDTECYDEKIRAVEGASTEDSFTVHFEGGGSFCPRNPAHLPLPKAGGTAKLYGRGFGYTVRGFAVGDLTYFYETAAKNEERHRKEAEKAKAEWLDKFIAEREEFDQKVAALPEEFRRRIHRFLLTTKEWGAEFGGYELFCCSEAVKIAGALKTDEAIVAFAKASNEEQKRMVPGGSFDEHSGNTFGTSALLARAYVTRPELLSKHHGALCPLVGCKQYGCWAAYEAESEKRP